MVSGIIPFLGIILVVINGSQVLTELTAALPKSSVLLQTIAAPTARKPKAEAKLQGTTVWALTELNGKPALGLRLILMQSGGQFSSCKEIIATYSETEHILRISPTQSRIDTCEPEAQQRYRLVVEALLATTRYHIRGNTLELSHDDAVLVKFRRFVRPEAPPTAEAKIQYPASSTATVAMFPWPPPLASAKQVIPNALWDSSLNRYGGINQLLVQALEKNGYFERSYFGAPPGGFVLVTRLERIQPDGRSMDVPARWSTGSAVSVKQFSLTDYVRALFTADPGYYRIIAFVVSDTPFIESTVSPTESQASSWLRNGMNVLPDSIAQAQFAASMTCTVLIYQFQRPGGTGSEAPQLVSPSPLDAHTHLLKSGLWTALGGR